MLDGPIPEWPQPSSSTWSNSGRSACPEEDDADEVYAFSPLALEFLINEMREVYPAYIGTFPSNLRARETASAESQIAMLRHWRRSLIGGRAPKMVMNGTAKHLHNSKMVLDCIRLVSTLQGSDTLHQTVKRSLELALPGCFVESFQKLVDAEKFPSAALLHRYELSLDVALLLLERQQNQTPSFYWIWSDSSFQAQCDWILAQYRRVAKSQLVDLFHASIRLERQIHDYVRAVRVESSPDDMLAVPLEPQEDWKDDLRVIRNSMQEHVMVPLAIGAGHRSLPHKCGRVAYGLALVSDPAVAIESNQDPVDDISASTVSHTGDMGVEMGIPDFRVEKASGLLPPWIDRSSLGPDIDDQSSVCEPVPDEQDEETPVDGILWDDDVDAGMEPTVATGGRVAVAKLSHTDSASGVAAEDGHFFQNGFTVSGVAHTTDNLLEDVHKSLKEWDVFYQ